MVVTRNCYGLMAINKSSFLFIGLFENGGRRNGLEVKRRRKPLPGLMVHKVGGRREPPLERATEEWCLVFGVFFCLILPTYLDYKSRALMEKLKPLIDHFKFVFETTLDFHQYIGRSAHSCIYRFYLFIFERCSVSPWAKLEITSNLVLPAIYLSSVCLSFFFSLIHKYTHTPRYKPEEFLIVHVHGSSPV